MNEIQARGLNACENSACFYLESIVDSRLSAFVARQPCNEKNIIPFLYSFQAFASISDNKYRGIDIRCAVRATYGSTNMVLTVHTKDTL